MYKIIILAALAITLTSCEGIVHPSGHVYDKISRQPIDSVQPILILDKSDTITEENEYTHRTWSNDSGYFEVSCGIVGMMFGGPKYRVLLLKKGFRPLEIKNTEDSIFMEKIQ